MIKDAKKEKGTDDFLGKVVVKLKVAKVLIFRSAILVFTVSQSDNQLHHLTSGSPLYRRQLVQSGAENRDVS